MDLQRNGAAFVLTLTHDEVTNFSTTLTIVAPELATILAPLITIVQTMDLIGGNNGVEISGSIGDARVLVLPHGRGVWGTLIHTVEELAAFVAKYTDPAVFLVNVGIQVVGHLVGAGRGEVNCDEDNAGSEETFIMFARGEKRVTFMYRVWSWFPFGPRPVEYYDATIVTILSFNGYFTASSDDKLVYANRGVAARDEEFELIHNGDGTVSFSSWLGYMSADSKSTEEKSFRRSLHPGGLGKMENHPSGGRQDLS